MRVGKAAHVVRNLQQLADTARTAARLINTSTDPPRVLGVFNAALASA